MPIVDLKSLRKIGWLAEVLRFTIFVNDPPILQPDCLRNYFIKIAKDKPEQELHNSKERSTRLFGCIDSNHIIVNQQMNRMDVLFAPIPERTEGGFPNIGELADVCENFSARVNELLGDLSHLNRIAVGMILLLPVDSLSAGYSKLESFLPFQLDSNNISDFLYTINRPIDSAIDIPNLKINRLSKWSVAALFQAVLDMGRGQLENRAPLEEHFACRLELDVNTSQHFKTALPSEKQQSLFEELLNSGLKIAEKGDK